MDARQKAAALLDVSLATYREEIQPDLPSDKSYMAAMVANAIGIAQRRLSADDPAETLLSALDVETLGNLARDIRSGAINDETHEALAEKLLDYLTAELQITNPRFLKRRAG